MRTVLRTRETAAIDSLHGSRKARRAGLLTAIVLAAGLGLSACGEEPSTDPGTASPAAQGDAGAAGDTTDPLVKYSACMRSNGVPAFPDPVNGQLQIQGRKGGDLDPTSKVFQDAQQACKALEPAGLANGGGQGGEQQDAMLKFVGCMRENGVPNFPDPQPDGRMLLDPSSGVDPQSAEFKAAQEECRTLLPGGVAPGPQ